MPRRYSLHIGQLALGALVLVGIGMWTGHGGGGDSGYLASLAPGSFRLSSPAFGDNTLMPDDYTCYGKKLNPPLSIENVPQGTKSFALTMDDADEVGGSRLHWELWNIPPDTISIPEGATFQGAIPGMTDFGNTQYNGPCFLNGQTHHYTFHLYALDETIGSLPAGSERALVSAAIMQHQVGAATLVGLYRHQ